MYFDGFWDGVDFKILMNNEYNFKVSDDEYDKVSCEAVFKIF